MQDRHDCDIQARGSTNPNAGEALQSGAVGALVGGAAGAAIGAVFGNPEAGAAVGGAVGAFGGTGTRAFSGNANYRKAFIACLRGRGHAVVAEE